MTERIRLAWWSLRVFPFIIVLGVAAFLVAMLGERNTWGSILLLVILVALLVSRLLSIEFFLGARWMRVPGPHAWHEDLVPPFGPGPVPREEPRYSEGRLLRLADVASWRRHDGGIEIRMKDGTARTFTLQGLRHRDRQRILDYLAAKLGG